MKISRIRPAIRGVLGAAVVVGLVVSSGCSSGEEAPVDEMHAEVQEPMAPTSDSMMSSAPMTTSPSSAPQEATGFDRVRQEQSLRQQKDSILVSSYLNIAQGHIDHGDFKKAEDAVLQALAVRDTDPRAIEMLQRVRTLQGDPATSVQDLKTFVVNQTRLRRQKTIAEVRDHYVAATNAFNQNELDEARIELEQASLRIKFDPFGTDFNDVASGEDLSKEVPAFLARVNQRIDSQKKANADSELREVWDQMQATEQRRQRREAEEIKALMVEGVQAFQRQDFENSEWLARKVLRRNPGFQPAEELLENSKQAKNVQWRQSFYELRNQRWRDWMAEVRETQIPYTDILQWTDPDKWSKIAARARRGDAIDMALDESEAVRAIKSKLENESISFNFGETETTLTDALRHIQSTQGINIVVDREVATEKGGEPVSINLTNANLGSALKLVLERQELAYTFKNDVLFVTTKEKALGQPVPRVYEVRDLTISLPHFKAPELELRPGGTGEVAKEAIWGADLDRTTDTTIENLVDLIRANVRKDTWENAGFALNPSGGNLVAVTTPEIHQQLEKFLDNLREFTKLVVYVESRFISITKADLLDVGFDFRGLGGTNPGTVALLDDVQNAVAGAGLDNGSPGNPAGSSLSPASGAFFNERNGKGDVRARTENVFDRALSGLLSGNGGATVAFTLLDDLEVTGLLRAVEQSANATLVNAPRLTIYNNQRANLTLVNQVSYVKDYDVEVAQTSFIADPLIDVIQDGLTLDVRPTISHDRKYVTMEVQPAVANLVRPIRTFETTLSGLSTPVVVELPEVTVQQASTTVRVPDGGYLTIGGFKQITSIDRRSETPILSNIPIISFLFTRKGRSDEIRDLIIVMHVRIVDLGEQEAELVN